MFALRNQSMQEACPAKQGCHQSHSNNLQCPLGKRRTSDELHACILTKTEQFQARGPVLYCIRISRGPFAAHEVLRRYTDFKHLWLALNAAGIPIEASMPQPRGVPGRLNPFGAAEKRRQLDDFLKAVLAAGSLAAPFVRDFLGLDRNRTLNRSRSSSSSSTRSCKSLGSQLGVVAEENEQGFDC
jgi:hypothetical protein